MHGKILEEDVPPGRKNNFYSPGGDRGRAPNRNHHFLLSFSRLAPLDFKARLFCLTIIFMTFFLSVAAFFCLPIPLLFDVYFLLYLFFV